MPNVELNRTIRESFCYCPASKSEVNANTHAEGKMVLLVILFKMTDILYPTTLRSSGATLAARVTYTLARVILFRIYIFRRYSRSVLKRCNLRGEQETRDPYVLDPFEEVLEHETSFAYVRIDNTHSVEFKLY